MNKYNSDYKLWVFNCPAALSGRITGFFLATQEEKDSLIGKKLDFSDYLPEMLSADRITVEEKHLKECQVALLTMMDLYNINKSTTISGYNPFNYLQEED